MTGYRNADQSEAIVTESAVEFAAYVDTWEESFATVSTTATSSADPQADECQSFIYVDVVELAVNPYQTK